MRKALSDISSFSQAPIGPSSLVATCVNRYLGSTMQEIEGIRRYPSGKPGPTVAIVGGLHGNEPCGPETLDRIAREVENDELRLLQGELVLLHGNPEATRQQRRYTRDGVDLNRIFDFAFEDTLPRDQWTYEHHRAMELRPVVDEWHAVLDIHSTSSPTEPFAIWPHGEPKKLLIQRMGIRALTLAWDGLGLPGSQALISVLSQQGRTGLVVECGQHDAPESVDRAYEYSIQFLVSEGLLEGDTKPRSDLRVYRMRSVIKKPTEDFRFNEQFQAFDMIPAGTELGAGITLDADAIVVMPNEDVPVGGDMLYLAEPPGI
ncbi:MAG: succinylglutamate desuccinylase/aspartoacylase family protein [Myxococcota bacterium]